MDARCPFCWSRHIDVVGPATGGRAAGGSRRLMECGECEKWFWADSGEEVVRLFDICATSLVNPGRCDGEIREILNSGGNGFPRRRLAEFNRVCSACLNARFISDKIALHA